jgi:hypothetical protein
LAADTMAWLGQTGTQAAQSMQMPGLITNMTSPA